MFRKNVKYLISNSSVVVYLSLGVLTALTVLLDKLGIGFGGNFGFRIFGLFLVIASLIFLRFFDVVTKHCRAIILILLLWLIISPITATIKATAPPFISGYLNSYSQSTACSIKWLNQEIDPPKYITTINEFQPKDYLENLVTLFAFRKLLLSDKSDYILSDRQILWHIKWLKQRGYFDRYKLAIAFVEETIIHNNKIYSSGYSSLFSLDNTTMPS